MAAVVVTLEIGGRGFAAQIAVDTLIIDVEFARYVFGVFVRDIGHGLPGKSEVERWEEMFTPQSNLAVDELARNRQKTVGALKR